MLAIDFRDRHVFIHYDEHTVQNIEASNHTRIIDKKNFY